MEITPNVAVVLAPSGPGRQLPTANPQQQIREPRYGPFTECEGFERRLSA